VKHRVITACCGVSVFDSIDIRVLPNLVPSIAAISTSPAVCPGQNVSFLVTNLQNAGNNPTFIWKKNGASIPNSNTSVFTTTDFQTGDIFTVEVVSDYACASPSSATSAPIPVTIFPKPIVSCNAPDSAGLGQTVLLTSTVTGGTAPFSYQWDLGNGVTATDSIAATAYSVGTYTATIVVTDANGCKDTCSTNIIHVIVPSPVHADFSVSAHEACDSLTVTFTNLSTGGITSYEWDFGDGTTSTLQNPPPKTYPVGYYTVRLIVRNSFLADTAIQTNTIRVVNSPTAQIGIVGTVFCKGSPVRFADIGSGATEWQWDFGDGNTSTLPSPQHVYQQAGNYTVRLKVKNFNGLCEDSTTFQVQVSDVPRADFDLIMSDSCAPVTVNFLDTSEPNQGTITNWTWLFSNGDSSLIQNPTVNLPFAGYYSATLMVTNTGGCSDTITKVDTILVYPVPIADFSASSTTVEAPNTVVNFTDLSQGATSWNWNFGNGITDATATPPPVDYNRPGTYTVELIVTSIGGCKDTATTTIESKSLNVLFVPNVFTPNGDGVNDKFEIKALGFDYLLEIYDRWGHLIFNNQNNKNNLWDGTKDGQPCPEGVYVYRIDATRFDGLKESRTGSVTLLR
ncbi:MAG: PKD domain-containing protein, partial [Bacteroidia bacterium]|nr:PKD domain-containing protein [Bacteroidia bacterium]